MGTVTQGPVCGFHASGSRAIPIDFALHRLSLYDHGLTRAQHAYTAPTGTAIPHSRLPPDLELETKGKRTKAEKQRRVWRVAWHHPPRRRGRALRHRPAAYGAAAAGTRRACRSDAWLQTCARAGCAVSEAGDRRVCLGWPTALHEWMRTARRPRPRPSLTYTNHTEANHTRLHAIRVGLRLKAGSPHVKALTCATLSLAHARSRTRARFTHTVVGPDTRRPSKHPVSARRRPPPLRPLPVHAL